MNYKKYLTPEERLSCWQVGFLRKVASVGRKPSDVGFDKSASVVGDIVHGLGTMAGAAKDSVSGFLAVALLSGLPIGTMLHLADNSLKRSSKKEKELKAQRDAYRDAMAQLKNHVAGQEGYMA